MFHTNRTWVISDVEIAEDLARDLARGGNWTLCAGFRHGGYLYLNDSLSEDSIQEFGVVREEDMKQVESITFGWCDEARALRYISEITAGTYDDYHYETLDASRIEQPDAHRAGSCCLCA
jgi:hypothetical protein